MSEPERGEKWQQWLKIPDTGIAGQGRAEQNKPKHRAKHFLSGELLAPSFTVWLSQKDRRGCVLTAATFCKLITSIPHKSRNSRRC